ncbi:MAG: hypothetical protein PWQ96_1468 [Clostridia bacterium]|nr:hypothetical protein [Clostridia bacterium]
MEELSLHILDILQNSVEAKADFIQLKIVEDIEKDILSIKIKDNGSGMDNEEASKACSPFYSTRKTRKIGMGLPLLQANAEACGGYLRLTSKKKEGTCVFALFRRSHWDTPPLGNIASSICTFLAWNEPVHLVYTHVVNKKTFTLDTREIIEKIDPLPINTPSILVWIKDYINSGLKDLKKGR